MKTILVVEDFLHARHAICTKLQRNGYHTRGAASVQEAYNVLTHESNEINLVLSDVDITDAHGFDLLRTIKNNPTLENIPVVFWSNNYRTDKTFFKEINRAINTKGSMINLIS
jgi:CheY-like chemotaxis protein